MAVDDYGIEVLKKAAEEVVPGDKSDYYIKTSLDSSAPLPLIGQRIVTGSITATNGSVEISAAGCATISFSAYGPFSASQRVQGTVDDINWINLTFFDVSSDSSVTSFNAESTYSVSCSGYLKIRIYNTAFISGSVNITMIGNPYLRNVQVYQPLASALRARVEQTGTWGVLPYGLTGAGKITEVTLNDSTWTALPVSPLSSRNALNIQNNSGSEIKINYDNTVATYTGIVIKNGEERFYNIDNTIIVYGKSDSGTTPTVIVEEIS